MAKITVLPYKKEITVSDGSNLREELIAAGLTIKSPCGGCASCSQCVITVKDNFDNLSEIGFEEKQILGNVFHITQERLSCQTTVLGDITIDISNHKQASEKPSKVVRRSKEDAEKIIEERKERFKDKPVRQGGFKRPKSFETKD